ncbi:hypothetical protein [Pseudomonas nitroreducens]|uniref:hypothetical protein n=1 Tax=Pseudomonas nitroreducens TaxID=46680 RepID=UPI00265A45B5|nr:hypothetical protein [Pseudomonas nitroreducens]MCP1647399.1 type II secretory pathway component PulC [Pseudomonas nitroreducens]MCP1685975.1 type II secretory pathway component PulC [Pseudomonas nitroreducens]
MILSNILRWYVLVVAVGVAYGFLAKPETHISEAEESSEEWALVEYSRAHYDQNIVHELAQMTWWKEDQETSIAREKEEAEKGSVKKVSWLFRGIVVESGKRYALIAEDAASPLRRYSPGESLPGGEVLEIIDKQDIRFSLPGEKEGKDLERKLYAPAE